ncbi:MAG: branched-chain amino acid transporter permease [Cryobacterium sp.]|jgi:branched-chain amino acid transport system permease protein|nr:branched-chain amino acid transporter permease [Cryobacterium sp.]
MSTLMIIIFNGLAVGVLLFLIAVGLSVIYGLMDVLNLTHGAMVLVGIYLAFDFVSRGIPFAVSLLLATAAGAVLGLLLYFVLKPLLKYSELTQALLTLGVAYIITDVIHAIWGTSFHSVPAPQALEGSVSLFGEVYPIYRLAVLVVGGILATAVILGFERTTYGAILRAAVQDREMLGTIRINVNMTFLGAFVLGTALASLGGALGAPILSASPGLDHQLLLFSLVIVVIGGLGSARGTLVGALLVGLVQSLGAAYSGGFAPFLLYVTMGLFLILRPSGLFGLKSARAAY